LEGKKKLIKFLKPSGKEKIPITFQFPIKVRKEILKEFPIPVNC